MGDEAQAMEGQQQDGQDDQQRDAHGPDQILLDGTCVRHGTQRCAVEIDAGVGMRCFEGLALLVEDAGELGGSARVGLLETGREEGQRDGPVGAEEVAVFNRVVADRAVHRAFGHQSGEKDVAQGERVGAHQPGRLTGHVALDQFEVPGHLRIEGRRFQRRGESLVEACVDEGRKVLEAIVHRPEGRLRIERTQDAPDVLSGGIALLQRVSEFVDIIAQRPGIERRFGVGRGDLDEDLVFQSDVAERQLTLDTRARQQLGHVLLIAQLRAEKNEYQRTERQQNI